MSSSGEDSNTDFLKGLNFDYSNPQVLHRYTDQRIALQASDISASCTSSAIQPSGNVDFLGHITDMKSPEDDQYSPVKKIHINQVRWVNQVKQESPQSAARQAQDLMQRESKFCGEDDPSPEQQTYDDLSSSEDDDKRRSLPPQMQKVAIAQQSEGALSQSELDLASGVVNVERQHIMEKLGDFSMSGLTASNINAGSQINKQEDFNSLSDISSDHEVQQHDSLEDRMDKIRKDLNFEYCGKIEATNMMSPEHADESLQNSQLESSQLQKSVLSTG